MKGKWRAGHWPGGLLEPLAQAAGSCLWGLSTGLRPSLCHGPGASSGPQWIFPTYTWSFCQHTGPFPSFTSVTFRITFVLFSPTNNCQFCFLGKFNWKIWNLENLEKNSEAPLPFFSVPSYEPQDEGGSNARGARQTTTRRPLWGTMLSLKLKWNTASQERKGGSFSLT